MRFHTSTWFSFTVLWGGTSAQFATTTTIVGGTAVYIPIPGLGNPTSTVATPQSTPTLIYNCFQMPLICENVAAWAKSQDPTFAGDLPQNQAQLFHFDPSESAKVKRRQGSCGCFQHDNCPSTTSGGKSPGVGIPQLALGPAPPYNPGSLTIIQAGVNPSPSTPRGQVPVVFNPRTPINPIPGRFYGQGIVYSCDEFPAATWIQGGDSAETICALQNWKINSGPAGFDRNGNPTNVGKWPLPNGANQEQDWQAASHVALRKVLGISKKNPGTNSVFPFFLSTTTKAISSSKAWVILNAATRVVTKRDAVYTLPPAAEPTTMVITGEETDGHVPLARRQANPAAISSTSSSLSSKTTGSSTSRSIVSGNSTITSSAKTTRPSTTLVSPTLKPTDTSLSSSSTRSSGGSSQSPSTSVKPSDDSTQNNPNSSTKSASSNTGSPTKTSSSSRISSSFAGPSSTSSTARPQGAGGIFTAPITIPPSGTRPAIVIPPQTTTYTGPTSLETLPAISGVSGSFSATTTKDSNDDFIILPIWFGPLGIIVIPLIPGPPGIIPPPPGFPPVFIGPDGNPTKSPDSQPTATDPATKPQTTPKDSTTTGPSTTSFSSSSRSSSSSQAGPSECTLSFDQDGEEDVDVGDEGFDDIDIGEFPTITFSSMAPTGGSVSASATSSGFLTSTRSSSQRSSTSSATQTSASPSSTGQLTCNQERPSGAPSGDNLASALTSNGGLENICAAKFDGSGTPTSMTFNHGSILINVQRGSTSEQLTFCQNGLNTIIDTCIKNRGFYGGVFVQGTQAYNISNIAFPANPLIPGADPGADPVSTAIPTTTAEPCASGCISDINGKCRCFGPGPVIITSPLPTPTPPPVNCPAGCSPAGGSCLCDGGDSPPPVQTIPADGGDGGGFPLPGPCDIPLIGLFC